MSDSNQEKKYYFLTEGPNGQRIEYSTYAENMAQRVNSSHGYESEEELKRGEDQLGEPCRKCGKKYVSLPKNGPVRASQLSRKVCFNCDYWSKLVDRQHEPHIARIGRCHFMIGDEKSKSEFRGYGGARFQILFHDGREVTTTNLWCQGDIPPQFWEELPDNAEFIGDVIPS